MKSLAVFWLWLKLVGCKEWKYDCNAMKFRCGMWMRLIPGKKITFFSDMSEIEVGNSENSYEMKIGQGWKPAAEEDWTYSLRSFAECNVLNLELNCTPIEKHIQIISDVEVKASQSHPAIPSQYLGCSKTPSYQFYQTGQSQHNFRISQQHFKQISDNTQPSQISGNPGQISGM